MKIEMKRKTIMYLVYFTLYLISLLILGWKIFLGVFIFEMGSRLEDITVNRRKIE
jgi:hypothetical protein